jgi:hypothetical protein
MLMGFFGLFAFAIDGPPSSVIYRLAGPSEPPPGAKMLFSRKGAKTPSIVLCAFASLRLCVK